ncbi:MAG TPA: diguanylate cyclase [Myxococcaceae bacterium]|nr:diguanylate cyclase [Myxococcaceae bacterium]
MGEGTQARKKGAVQPRVLVVDPHDAELEKTAAGLRAQGFRVASLSRPEAALTLYDIFRPDAVVLGAQSQEPALPLARRLHQRSGGTLPIFYLLEAPTPEAVRRCLERGQGVDVLARDVDTLELTARIRGQLRLREAQERAARDAVRTPSLHDPLTGVYNRRFFLALTTHEMRRCERYGGGFSVVAASIRGFAQLKTELGRERADRLIVYTSMVLCQTAREADVVARVGDGEFALLLPGAPSELVHHFLERLHARFEWARFPLDGREFRPQVVLGAVSFPDLVGSATQLLTTAFQDSRRPRNLHHRASGAALGS